MLSMKHLIDVIKVSLVIGVFSKMFTTVFDSFCVSPGFTQSFTEEEIIKIVGEFPPQLQHYLIS